jgi:hypothetical protein
MVFIVTSIKFSSLTEREESNFDLDLNIGFSGPNLTVVQ